MVVLWELRGEFGLLKNPRKIEILSRFFKTGKGQYGEGDVFLGITVPMQRELAKKYVQLSLSDVKKLIWSDIHEHRLTGLLILVYKSKGADERLKKELFDFYMKNISRVNNWDLVDCTAERIVGAYISDKDRSILYSLVKSENLWERRIAMISCFHFIKKDDFADALKIAELLLEDKHDLIHKAVGWMLREIGKRDQTIEEEFLEKHKKTMPRTALRYAIERFPEEMRNYYLGRKQYK
ncbi:MAG: DNA alkylation repair protein [Nanoarchaeota archaeon]